MLERTNTGIGIGLILACFYSLDACTITREGSHDTLDSATESDTPNTQRATPNTQRATTNTQADTSNLASLRSIGRRTFDALKTGDAAFLASMADDRIALGTDNPIMSSADFKRELSSRTGVYCDLLGCADTRNSVRALLAGKTHAVRALTSTDSLREGQVDVFEVGPGESLPGTLQSPVLTLLFVRRGETWRLTAIEYI